MDDLSGLLTSQDVARLLRLKPSTVRRWARRGRLPRPLPFGPTGRSLRWRSLDLEQFIASLDDGAGGCATERYERM